MNAVFAPNLITVEENRNKPPAGQYSLRADPLEWIGCRERIAALFKENTTHLFFSVEQSETVARFIHKTEEIINLPEHTTFQRTNRNHILSITPQTFWTQCPIRRSLFTILLRQGLRYNPAQDNYEDALFHNDLLTRNYTTLTKPAVTRFLFGFTHYNGPTTAVHNIPGWVTLFKNATPKIIRERLIQPNPEPPILVGAGSLWA